MRQLQHKIIASREDVARFNSTWPGSKLRDRSYWFEFDRDGDLVDTDVPEQDDGPEASAMADDCRAYYMDDLTPTWAKT